MPKDDNNDEDELFGTVSQTSAEEMFEHLFRSGGYKDEDLEQKDKKDDYNLRKTWKEVKAKALCFSAYIVAACIVLTLVTVVIIMWRYLYLIFQDKQELSLIVSGILSYLFGVASTLCVEFIFEKRRK